MEYTARARGIEELCEALWRHETQRLSVAVTFKLLDEAQLRGKA